MSAVRELQDVQGKVEAAHRSSLPLRPSGYGKSLMLRDL